MRILHVLGKLDPGGVETWLVQMLRELDRSHYQCDFLVHTDASGAYDAEVRQLGANIIPCLSPDRPLTYARNFFRILRQHGPYDVVHSHVHYYSGYVLALAKVGGVPVRIAHSHTEMGSVERKSPLRRKAYCALMRGLLTYSATGGFAVSSQSGDCLFPDGWAKSNRWKVAYLGIDLSRFSEPVDRTTIRQQLGLDKASIVIGHVGSMGYGNRKNQDFIIKIAMELLKAEPEAMFLLVGQGPRFSAIKQAISDRGLSDHFVLPGQRPDVPLLLRGAMDVFLFPSLWEGLSIALLEAQAAGLPCLISDTNTQDADVVEELITRESLEKPASEWALSIARLAHLPRLASEVACSRMQSRSIRTSCEELIAAYKTFALHVN